MNRRTSGDPAAIKFQRLMTSATCLLSVLFGTPVPLYLLLLTILPGLVYGSRYDGLGLIYKRLVVPAVGKNMFSFEGKSTGLFLLGLDVETFLYSVISIFILTGVMLAEFGQPIWILPISIVAAGMGVAGTTGICLMSILYLQVRKCRRDV